MRIGVLTFHRAHNYGAVLQAYALQRVLLDLGHECELVDYRSPTLEERYRRRAIWEFLTPRSVALILLRNAVALPNDKAFSGFSERNLVTSRAVCDSLGSLSQAAERYDILLTGSDQVWNYRITGLDPAYFLALPFHGRTASYAASFGLDEVPAERIPRYSELLSHVGSISVREPEGAAIVGRILKRRVPVVLDPTLLLNRDAWLRQFERSAVGLPPRYGVAYLMAETTSALREIGRVSREKGVPFIHISDRLRRRGGMRTARGVTPEEWVGLFSRADYVVTNSFHGAAFALNFNVPFTAELLPERYGVNSRVRNLMEVGGIPESPSQPGSFSSIDGWDSVNAALAGARGRSLDFLESVVTDGGAFSE